MQKETKVVDVRPVPWTSAEACASCELRLHYRVRGQVLARVDVAETTETVTVTLFAGRLPGDARPQHTASSTTLVTLREPLGHRWLVDGASRLPSS
ncbi:MAG TPA: hypothetical protein VJX66_06885 [Amycolatopsis sp.]|nr:hypothetical protein [Amycolatopsis sp.]